MITSESFSLAYSASFTKTINYLRRKGIHDAEDIASAAWARAWVKRHQYSSSNGATIFTWVAIIALNEYRFRLRLSAAKCRTPPEHIELQIPNPESRYNDSIDARKALSRLSPSDAEILRERFYLNSGYKSGMGNGGLDDNEGGKSTERVRFSRALSRARAAGA